LIYSARFSPDGERLVTASADGTARVWNARTGEPITPPLLHSDEVLSACFSRDGQSVVTASDDRSARVWNAQTGRKLADLWIIPIGPLSTDGKVISLQRQHRALACR
jgi:WD40 repeat protein